MTPQEDAIWLKMCCQQYEICETPMQTVTDALDECGLQIEGRIVSGEGILSWTNFTD